MVDAVDPIAPGSGDFPESSPLEAALDEFLSYLQKHPQEIVQILGNPLAYIDQKLSMREQEVVTTVVSNWREQLKEEAQMKSQELRFAMINKARELFSQGQVRKVRVTDSTTTLAQATDNGRHLIYVDPDKRK